MEHTYTDEEKRRIRGMIEAFEGAKQHLPAAVRDHCGICAAIGRWYHAGLVDITRSQKRSDALRLIKRSLGPHIWLELWQGSPRYQTHRTARLRNRQLWIEQILRDLRAAL